MEFVLGIGVGDVIYGLETDLPCAGGQFRPGWCIDFDSRSTPDRLQFHYRHPLSPPLSDSVLTVEVVLQEWFDGRYWVICSNALLFRGDWCEEERVVKWLVENGFEKAGFMEPEYEGCVQ